MAYRKDLRIKANEYLDARHTRREARKTFGISFTAMNSWRKKYKAGDLSDKPVCRSFRKLDPEKLKAYVAEHPDAYLQEIGDASGCSDTAVLKAFRRLGITRKERRSGIGSRNRDE
jgi:putative transposase